MRGVFRAILFAPFHQRVFDFAHQLRREFDHAVHRRVILRGQQAHALFAHHQKTHRLHGDARARAARERQLRIGMIAAAFNLIPVVVGAFLQEAIDVVSILWALTALIDRD